MKTRMMWAAGFSLLATAAHAQDVPAAHYVCFYFGRPLPLMNFTIQGGGRYIDAGGKPGTYSYSDGRIAFSGGNLTGQHAILRPGSPPHIGILGTGGRETENCQPGR
jgi:hypothetical protein